MAAPKTTFPDKSVNAEVISTDFNQLKASANGAIDDAVTAQTTANAAQPKETGKGLSSNDYTNTEKNKLAGIATGANAYTDAMALAANAQAIADSQGYQAETLAYYNRVKSISDTVISGQDLSFFDSFVAEVKSYGFWSGIKGLYVPLGENLKTSLVKLVVDASGLPSMVANNLVESDYVKNKGFYFPTNNGTLQKWISTGMILTNNGITPSSVGCGFCIPDYTQVANPGNFVADNPASGNSNFYIGLPAAGTKRWTHNFAGVRVQTFSKNAGAGATSINGGRAYYAASGLAADEDFSTEITIAKSTQTGVVSYSPVSLGGLVITTGLNQTQVQQLNVALFKFMSRLGRVNPVGGGMLGFGDSIMFAQSAFPYFKRFATLVAKALNLNELNVGVSTSQLRQVNGNALGGFDRYLEYGTAIAFNTVLLMYGTNDMLADAQANGTAATITDYQTKLTAIINYWIGLGKQVIFASTIPYVAGNLTKNTAYFNAQLAAAKATRVPFIDCMNIFYDTNSLATYIPDGLHPSQIGNLLIADHIIARTQGKQYRDLLVSATLVTANTTVNQTFTLVELKNLSNLLISNPVNPTTGITYSVGYSADDVAVLRITNNTGVDITTTATNIRVTLFTDI